MKAIALTFYALKFKIRGTQSDYVTLGSVEPGQYATVSEAVIAVLESLPKQNDSSDYELPDESSICS